MKIANANDLRDNSFVEKSILIVVAGLIEWRCPPPQQLLNIYCQQIVARLHTIDKKDQRLINFYQWLIDFINY